MQTRDQCAEIDLHENENEQRRGTQADAPRRCHRRAGCDSIGRPDQRRIDEAGERKMKGEPVLRNRDALGEPRGHHPPAHRALHRAQGENPRQGDAEPAIDPAAPHQPQERQQEHRADQAAEHPVAPLPPEDGLELLEAHATIDALILRDGLVFIEFRLPIGLRQRRHDPGDRLPFDDG
jgi:hypothetical protein